MKNMLNRILAVALAAFMLAGCTAKAEEPAGTQDIVIVGGGYADGAENALPETEAADGETNDGTHQDPGISLDTDVIVIPERLFIAQTNELYLNYELYLGKTIRYEGFFLSEDYADIDGSPLTAHYVLRWGPGCCGFDGTAGFEILYDGDLPQEDDWCLVEGTLVHEEINGWILLYLDVTSLEILDERGSDYVAT